MGLVVGGSQTMTTLTSGITVGGAVSEQSASYCVITKEEVTRSVKGSWSTKAGGNLTSEAAKKHYYQTKGNMTIKASNLDAKGTKIVFTTDGGHVVLSDKGLINKGDISISGGLKLSKVGHQQWIGQRDHLAPFRLLERALLPGRGQQRSISPVI